MGIPALWDVIKEQDHSVSIAQLAQDHFQSKGSPLKIAVDEADWRFNNLTAQQVYIIREKSDQPAFQGIEKSMFYRICRLLTLNIQLLFVFDGPKRPWKRGRVGQGRIDYEKRRLLQEMLRCFRIPYHEALGEAEAECARLQQLGVVDAVWSQDSDSLMFGCDFLIRDDRVAKEKGNNDRSKENTKKNKTTVRVVRGREIQQTHHMDREGLVLFAMLCGGDYDMKGLEKCGSALAVRAVRAGLGESLCRCQTQKDCMNWREELVTFLQSEKRYHGFVPLSYPDIRTLNKYNRPTVRTDEELLNLRGLESGWNRPIKEVELLKLTGTRFNIWGQKYMDWIGPILLTKFLVAKEPHLPRELVHDIKITKRRTKQASNVAVSTSFLRKITFSAFSLSTLQRKDFEGERTGYWTSFTRDPFDPNHRVEVEMPSYLLERALPEEILDPPPALKKTPRKRKHQEEPDMDDYQTASGRKRTRATPADKQQRTSAPTSHSMTLMSTPTHAPHRLDRNPRIPVVEHIDLCSDSEDDITPAKQPRKAANADTESLLTVSEDEEEQLRRAIQLSLDEHTLSKTCSSFQRSTQQRINAQITNGGRNNALGALLLAADCAVRAGSQRIAAMSADAATGMTHDPNRHTQEIYESVNKSTRSRSFTEAPSWSFPSPYSSKRRALPEIDQLQTLRNSDHLDFNRDRALEASPVLVSELSQPTHAAEIRAARLQFFDPDKNIVTRALPASPYQAKAAPVKKTYMQDEQSQSASKIAEIETIDLTDL